jgi:hypothetical protein
MRGQNTEAWADGDEEPVQRWRMGRGKICHDEAEKDAKIGTFYFDMGGICRTFAAI